MDGPLNTSLVTMWELMKPSWCPNPNAGLIWDLTAEIELEGIDDESLHDLAMIHQLLALKLKRQEDKQPTEPSEWNSPSDWKKEGTCLASSWGMEGHVCGNGHCLKLLNEHHRQLAKWFGSMSDKNEIELIADCHGVTEVNMTTALGFCTMTSSIESLECLERAHELVTYLSVEVFPGALQTEEKIGSWREALENERNLVRGASAAPDCKSKNPTQLVVIDARTQHRLSRMSEKSHELLTKILGAVPESSWDDMEEIVGEDFVSERNISEFQRKKADFPTIDEKDETHQMMMKIEPLLIATSYRTWRNILLSHGEYPCHCLAQTFWYPKRANLVLVWDAEELYSMGLPDQTQNVTILLVSAMLAVGWLLANAGTTEQKIAVPTPEQLSRKSLSKRLELNEGNRKNMGKTEIDDSMGV